MLVDDVCQRRAESHLHTREKRTHSRNTSMGRERARESFALLLHEDDALILRIVLVCFEEAGEKLQQRVALARH